MKIDLLFTKGVKGFIENGKIYLLNHVKDICTGYDYCEEGIYLLEKEYNSKLNAIEKNIKDEITKKAQKDNYDYVFAKSVLLYGGKDITNEIHVK